MTVLVWCLSPGNNILKTSEANSLLLLLPILAKEKFFELILSKRAKGLLEVF